MLANEWDCLHAFVNKGFAPDPVYLICCSWVSVCNFTERNSSSLDALETVGISAVAVFLLNVLNLLPLLIKLGYAKQSNHQARLLSKHTKRRAMLYSNPQHSKKLGGGNSFSREVPIAERIFKRGKTFLLAFFLVACGMHYSMQPILGRKIAVTLFLQTCIRYVKRVLRCSGHSQSNVSN